MKYKKLDYCQMCGLTKKALFIPLEVHHIFNGANKKNSEKYADTCLMTLCFDCHRRVHDSHKNLDLKREAQKKTMDTYQMTTEEFIRIFHRNYL